jgi:hypothetical protein
MIDLIDDNSSKGLYILACMHTYIYMTEHCSNQKMAEHSSKNG